MVSVLHSLFKLKSKNFDYVEGVATKVDYHLLKGSDESSMKIIVGKAEFLQEIVTQMQSLICE